MKEFAIRLFVESDAGAVQNIIHRGLREINGKDYPAELIEEYCAYFTLEKIKSQADSHIVIQTYGNANLINSVQNSPCVNGSKNTYWIAVVLL